MHRRMQEEIERGGQLAGRGWLRQPAARAVVALGISMRMCLYDAAFAALVQVTPSRGRRAISYLTLFGGFASSVFWPIAHSLNAAYGWRSTLIIFAAINLSLCLPLHWIGLAQRESPAPAQPAAAAAALAGTAAPELEGAARTLAM